MKPFRLIRGGLDDRPGLSPVFSHAAWQVEVPASDGFAAIHADQILRRKWAQDRLRAEGVPINPYLPVTEGETEVRLRSPEEVGDRALALAIVAAKAGGVPQRELERIIEERGADGLFSPVEQEFIDDPAPDRHARAQLSWRYEAAWVLLWALRLVGSGPLPRPEVPCDIDRLFDVIHDTPNLARRGLHAANDILNEADVIFRYHWAVRQAQLDGVTAPAGLEPSIVAERHHALNWLVSYCDEEWDDVTTDT